MSAATNIRNATIGAAAIAAAVLPFVATEEGLSLVPYTDIGRVVTWCYGETAGTPKAKYTKPECDALLLQSLTKHAQPVLDCLPPAAPKPVKMAFVSFGYNVGVKGACGSSAAAAARRGDFPSACRLLTNWVYVKKVRIPGLVNRRNAERKLCESGLA